MTPKNSCKACSQEEDCGHSLDGKVWYCQNAKDSVCGGSGNTSACVSAPPDYCKKKYDDRSFCDPTTKSTQQLGDGCSCPVGVKAVAGKCPGAPSSYFCKYGIKTNACGMCKGDADCGGEAHACWADKDPQCPKTAVLEELFI